MIAERARCEDEVGWVRRAQHVVLLGERPALGLRVVRRVRLKRGRPDEVLRLSVVLHLVRELVFA